MSFITDVPKDFVIVENKKIPVYTDFRNWIKIDGILADKSVSEADKIADILALCFKRLPDNLGQAFKAATEFYNPFLIQNQKGHLNKNSRRLYSFEYDAPYIYAAFLSEYNIDLHSVSMHWHTFLALMMSLGSECVFSRIVSIRGADISELSGKQKNIYLRLKRIYALPAGFISDEAVASELYSLF